MEEENWSKSKKNDGKQNMLPNRFGSSFSIEMPAELSAQVAKHMPCQLDSARGSSEVVFWSHGDGEELAHLRQLYPSAGVLAIHGDLFKYTIKFMLQQLLTDCQYYGCLVQFWAPIGTNTQIFLSTADQPFAITKDLISNPQFLLYRRHCLDAIIPLDDQRGGPAARVFEHGFPEFNSLISTYSHQEFPMLDAAISSGIRAYLALPVFSAPGQCCIGVLEIISSSSTIFRTLKQLHRLPKVVHLMSSQMFLHFCGDLTLHSNKIIGDKSELTKLRNTLSGVCQTYKLPMAQTWIPALGTDSLQLLITAPETIYYDKQKLPKDFTCYSDLYSLRKGQWVVGRAFSSQGCCFCWDASQMTITEYPMLPFARHAGLKSSFAICLRCTSNENSVYVVELYLCPLLWSAIRNFLNELMRILKEQLPDFRVASGEKLGKCLHVEVIKTCEDEDISSFEIGEHEHEHSPKADVVLGDFDDLLYLIEEEEIVQPHPHLEVDTTLILQNSCEEKAPEADATNASKRCDADHSEVEELQNGEKIMLLCSEIDTASEQNQQTRQSANRIRRWNQDYGITREVLEQLFEKSRDDAAKTLDVSPSTLKRACRDFGIARWRNHKRRRPNCSLKGICQTETCPVLPQEQGTTAIQGNSTAMTAKVTYKEHTFKFPLSSSSSTMKYLEEEVTRRLSYLNISLDTFLIKYQDEEDEWISLGCDSDLMYGMSMLRSSGKIVIRMMVHPNSH